MELRIRERLERPYEALKRPIPTKINLTMERVDLLMGGEALQTPEKTLTNQNQPYLGACEFVKGWKCPKKTRIYQNKPHLGLDVSLYYRLLIFMFLYTNLPKPNLS